MARLALAALGVGLSFHDAGAQTALAIPPQATGQQPSFSPLTTRWTFPEPSAVNAGTVTIITAPAGGAESVFAADMARVLDEQDKLRVLPVLGKGPVQNVIDLLYLRSIDMGLVATDVPEFYKIQYGTDITDRLRYIMKLYNDEIHIIAPKEIEKPSSIWKANGSRRRRTSASTRPRPSSRGLRSTSPSTLLTLTMIPAPCSRSSMARQMPGSWELPR